MKKTIEICDVCGAEADTEVTVIDNRSYDLCEACNTAITQSVARTMYDRGCKDAHILSLIQTEDKTAEAKPEAKPFDFEHEQNLKSVLEIIAQSGRCRGISCVYCPLFDKDCSTEHGTLTLAYEWLGKHGGVDETK